MHRFVQSASKALMREIFAYHVIRFRHNGQKPIFLYANRRGGSTAFAQAIAATWPVIYLDQPFSVTNIPNYYFSGLIGRNYGPLTSTHGIENSLAHYVQQLIDGTLRPGVVVNPKQLGFRIFTEQVLAKMTNAKTIAKWTAERFDVRKIIFYRHPVAQALSTLKAGWKPVGEGYLKDRIYIDQVLQSNEEKIASQIYSSDNLFAKLLLDWILDNIFIFRQGAINGAKHIFFEDLVLSPSLALKNSFPEISPDNLSLAVAALQRPSRSTHFSTQERRDDVKYWNTENIVSSWHVSISSRDREIARSQMNYLSCFLFHFIPPLVQYQ